MENKKVYVVVYMVYDTIEDAVKSRGVGIFDSYDSAEKEIIRIGGVKRSSNDGEAYVFDHDDFLGNLSWYEDPMMIISEVDLNPSLDEVKNNAK